VGENTSTPQGKSFLECVKGLGTSRSGFPASRREKSYCQGRWKGRIESLISDDHGLSDMSSHIRTSLHRKEDRGMRTSQRNCRSACKQFEKGRQKIYQMAEDGQLSRRNRPGGKRSLHRVKKPSMRGTLISSRKGGTLGHQQKKPPGRDIERLSRESTVAPGSVLLPRRACLLLPWEVSPGVGGPGRHREEFGEAARSG